MQSDVPGGRLAATVIDVFTLVVLGSLIATANYEPLFIGFVVLWLLYAPLMYVLADGRTLGKMAGRVRVVKKNGEPIGFFRAFIREHVLKLLLSPLMWASLLMIAFREDGRALHDFLAGTRVVKASPSTSANSVRDRP